MTGITAGQRIVAALEDLGISQAHFGFGALPFEMADVAATRPGMVASLLTVLSGPLPPPLQPGLRPVAAVIGNRGMPSFMQTARELRASDAVECFELPPEYDAQPWSDPVTDQPTMIREAFSRLAAAAPIAAVELPNGEREVEGVRVSVDGSGPPLALLPSGFWPNQWDAAVSLLAADFTVVRLGGRHLGWVAGLEQRAAEPGYVAMVDLLFERLAVSRGDRVLEVGPGTGALMRQLARRAGAGCEITGVDINAFFLKEAQILAEEAGLPSKLRWQFGSAESLPFEDETFDAVYSVTVLEECDADRALAEMHRVLRPGGRVGVIIRATDAPYFWNLDLPEAVRDIISAPRPEPSDHACSTRSIYTRMSARFTDVNPWVHWLTSFPIRDQMVNMSLPLLAPEDRPVFLDAVAQGKRAGTAFASMPTHCVVATKPA